MCRSASVLVRAGSGRLPAGSGPSKALQHWQAFGGAALRRCFRAVAGAAGGAGAGAGLITGAAFRAALRTPELGGWADLTDAEVHALLRRFDTGRADGKVAYADFVRFVLTPSGPGALGGNPKTKAERAASREKDKRAALELARKRALRTGGARPLDAGTRRVVAPSAGRRDLGGAGRATQTASYLRNSRPF